MLELLTLALCIQTLPCTQILWGGAEREPPKRGRNPKEVLATSREKTHALSESSAYQTLP